MNSRIVDCQKIWKQPENELETKALPDRKLNFNNKYFLHFIFLLRSSEIHLFYNQLFFYWHSALFLAWLLSLSIYILSVYLWKSPENEELANRKRFRKNERSWKKWRLSWDRSIQSVSTFQELFLDPAILSSSTTLFSCQLIIICFQFSFSVFLFFGLGH